MRKIVRIMFPFIVLIFIITLVGCKKKTSTTEDSGDYKVQKIEYKSKFSDTIFTVKCSMDLDTGTTKYSRPYFKADLELSELKSKTNAELYYETDKELVFKKDDSFFVIDEIGDHFYRIHID